MVFSRRRGLRRAVGQRVVVHTGDDRTIDGVLVGVYFDAISVAHAKVLQPGDAPDIPLGGETVILRENVSFVQVSP